MLPQTVMLFCVGFASLVHGQFLNIRDHSYLNVFRKIEARINPGCNETECTNHGVTILHLKAVGQADTVHFLWDFTAIPTVVMARTDLNSSLEIDWDALVAGNETNYVRFTNPPFYYSAVLFTKFWVYDDIRDEAQFPPANGSIFAYPTDLIRFSLSHVEVNTSNTFAAVFKSAESEEYGTKEGNFQFSLSISGLRDRSPVLPHLMHTENSTQVDIIVENMAFPSNVSRPRVAAEVALVSSESPKHNISLDMRKSMDDEYTPGVFELWELATDANALGDGTFLQWRPVSYTSRERDIADSTAVRVGAVNRSTSASSVRRSIALRGFLNASLEELLVANINVSFGVEGDGFYSASNYTAWTVMAGLGKPTADGLSLMVVLVIAIGLGLPVLIILVGTLILSIRKCAQTKDDLLLSS